MENHANIHGTDGGSVTVGLPKFKIKVPQTLEQAIKLKAWLETILNTLSGPAYRFASNIVYQIKGAKTQEDIDRLQPFMAYQAKTLNQLLQTDYEMALEIAHIDATAARRRAARLAEASR
ncbi:hypothetical protein ABIF26_008255 [Bradyrhizobium elkanii]|uniref:hypothetical protein n=1 Tax=Bradyrhizobium elkanii TaxID=29448 RepID=UPI00351162A5